MSLGGWLGDWTLLRQVPARSSPSSSWPNLWVVVWFQNRQVLRCLLPGCWRSAGKGECAGQHIARGRVARRRFSARLFWSSLLRSFPKPLRADLAPLEHLLPQALDGLARGMRSPEQVGQTLRNARPGMGRWRCRKPVGCEPRAPHRLQHALITDPSDCRDFLHPPRGPCRQHWWGSRRYWRRRGSQWTGSDCRNILHSASSIEIHQHMENGSCLNQNGIPLHGM